MGIICKENIGVKTQDEFYSIDKIVMGLAFNIQNTLGKFCDEKYIKRFYVENVMKIQLWLNAKSK